VRSGAPAFAGGVFAAGAARRDLERPLDQQALLADVGAVAEEPRAHAPPCGGRARDPWQEAARLVAGPLTIPFPVHPGRTFVDKR
jgi:hypothetical protein